MKNIKFIYFFVFFACHASIYGQAITDTGSKVGVLNTAPNVQLSVGSSFGASISGSSGGHAVFGTNIGINQGGANHNKLYTPHSHVHNFGYAGIHAFWGKLEFYANAGNTSSGTVIYPTSRLTIEPDGNIGIGTNSPKTVLDISGGARDWNESIQGLLKGTVHIDPENSTNNYGGAITFGASDDFSSGEDGQAGIYVRSDGSYGTKMYFSTTDNYANGSKMAMMINHSGNIGIGTTTPSEKLEVNGTIRTKEVKVESTPWPDYVFSDTYHLNPLSEVSSYIRENHHLPGIPTAEEVAENGIKLGEMNAKLLEKIEELTLYLIEMKEENEEMKDNYDLEIDRLKNENNEFKTRLEKLEKESEP